MEVFHRASKICLAILALLCFAACGKENTATNSEPVSSNPPAVSESETAANRAIIAAALGIDEEERSIGYILESLGVIGAGEIRSAEISVVDLQNADDSIVDGENALHVVAEDGTNYLLYLSGSGSVEAVENMDTGEWPIQSER